MEIKHKGCFVCGGGKSQALLQSIMIYKVITTDGETLSVPRSIAVCDDCAAVTEVDLRQTAGK